MRCVSTISKVVMVLGVLVVTAGFAMQSAGPQFEGKTTLLRPQDHREWIFVGSSLGLAYAQNPEQASRNSTIYHNVYINPLGYRGFVQTGKFPEGAMMALELFTSEVKKEPGLQGSYEKDFVALEFSVKDSSRFEGGWGYYNFTERGAVKDKAEAQPQNTCWACHNKNAATDHVFTQFYPVLRPK
jgi:hypothetical protein